jgi:hypothetical protein
VAAMEGGALAQTHPRGADGGIAAAAGVAGDAGAAAGTESAEGRPLAAGGEAAEPDGSGKHPRIEPAGASDSDPEPDLGSAVQK